MDEAPPPPLPPRPQSESPPPESGEEALVISAPFDVKTTFRATFNQDRSCFEGLPSEFRGKFNQQFGLAIEHVPRVPLKGYETPIPAVLVMLKENLIAQGGLKVEGIFRLAPDADSCRCAKKAINEGNFEGKIDVECASTLIKVWYRELKPAILDGLEKTDIMKAADTDLPVEDVLKRLPRSAYDCLLWLLDLLCDVAEHADVNRMSMKNLAICVSPNLYSFASATENATFALIMSQKVAVLTMKLLEWRSLDRRVARFSCTEEEMRKQSQG